MNGEQDAPTPDKKATPRHQSYRVRVELLPEEPAAGKDGAAVIVDRESGTVVLDVCVETPIEFESSARGEGMRSILLQQQIRAALEAARPGGS